MRRILLWCVSALAFGALVTMAVAWSTLAWGVQRRAVVIDSWLTSAKAPAWNIVRSRKLGIERFAAHPIQHQPMLDILAQGSATAPPDSVLDHLPVCTYPPTDALHLTDTVCAYRAGLPFKCLSCYFEYTLTTEFPPPTTIRGGFDIGSPATANNDVWHRVIPVRPLVFPFAVNTVVYAFIGAAILTGSRLLLRTIRALRGRCPRCGYPVGDSTSCSECGERITVRPVA